MLIPSGMVPDFVCSTIPATASGLVYSSTNSTVRPSSSICSRTSAISAADGSPSGSNP